MDSNLFNSDYEFLRPLTTSWLTKIEAAHKSRKHWKELADECMMFYSKSAAAMWNPDYSRKFWKGVEAPRFRISINKAFEYVAIMAPNLFWNVPYRTVEPKRPLAISPEMLPQDPMSQMYVQSLMQQQQQADNNNEIVAMLLQDWLNYTPGELPEGGLSGHSWMSLLDALIKGRGVMTTRPYIMPGSGRVLTGCFREEPENLLIDPDFKKIGQAKFIAIRHVDDYRSLEERFELPAGSLKGRASLESCWHYAEVQTQDGTANMHRANGQTNDLVVWYEIFSKCGVGARMTGMPDSVRNHLDDVVGKYAYLAIAANVPYPLNCPTAAFRPSGPNNPGATDAEIKEMFSWPIPLWQDDRWPVQLLDFYPDPDSAWPIPPLAPAMGELKFINFMVPWLSNRIWSSCRDFWAVAGPHLDDFKKYLEEGKDQVVIPVPAGITDIREKVMVLQQPETREDAWRIVELAEELFEKRTGMTESAYGRNENGTQDRTAEATAARSRAVGARPEFMQNQVVAWQSEMAAVEAMVARQFVTGEHVEARMGPLGRMLWEQHVMSSDVESVMRQMGYSIAAASIRRPNRDRDVANYQQVMSLFLPVAQAYGTQTGDFTQVNELMQKWGDYHDTDLSGVMFPPPQPPQPDPKIEADLQLAQLEMQGKQLEIEGKQQESQAKLQLAGLQAEQARQKLDADSAKGQLSLLFNKAGGEQKLMQDQDAHVQDMRQSAEEFQLQLAQQAAQGMLQLKQSEEINQAKVQATKAQAAAKPKPAGSKA
ncbi:hypothetical protein [Planctomicrobium piriforme]|uniref:Portal protein n=1 Tax=Planctomicrobium piriforme TaxID=1576369 RepID=A0A1I3ECU8_9PLAN|nr:hypothetical protein [Planctomicrobium piriforme]SFH96810.1 hypothetical protein SAMN05421753_104169 [Planctomicrobium piriforme]